MNLIDTLLAEASPQEQQRVQDRMMMAARLADALAEKGWSQKQLAQQMGKQPSEISKWLSGTHNFTLDTLSDLAQVLDIKLLCVKDDESKVVTQTVILYGRIQVSANRHHPVGVPVQWNSFKASIGQS